METPATMFKRLCKEVHTKFIEARLDFQLKTPEDGDEILIA